MNQLTPAEFKANRERLGLSTRWLADRWHVQEQVIQRWERRRAAPNLVDDLLDLVDLFDTQVISYMNSQSREYVVPRVSHIDGYPAQWWRAAALEAARHTGATMTYDPNNT